MSLAWKLNRLSAMEPAEIVWRAGRELRGAMEQCGLFAAHAPRHAKESYGAAWLARWPEHLDVNKYRAAADRILAGEFDVFAMKGVQLGFPPRWNRDPKTGRDAPLRFGKSLDYRNEKLVGDIKYLWEPSRHAELIALAQAWRLTRDDRYSMGCRTLLASWFDECPYPMGPHWVSSLEHGVRLLNWAFAWQLLGGANSPLFESRDGRDFRDRWLSSIYQHCHFIAGHLSRYSSANNHLLGELTGLFVAALTWPCWPHSARWAEHAHRELEEQALMQNSPDGVNREQAVWYHHEVLDMMIVAGLVGRANGRDFAPAYWGRLEAMLEFLASIMDAGGNVPAFGDADDAVIARFDADPRANVYASLLATGAVLFERSAFACKAPRFDDKSRWLLGDAAAERFRTLQEEASPHALVRCAFPDAGYYVLGRSFETSNELRIVFDAGPLGYRSIAAHGHADALSFTLSLGGFEFLIDPGTFAYHTQKRWRDYFRGTSAHNTLRIDGIDQSQSGGNFLWLTHARARLLEFDANEAGDRIVAEHDGYQRLPDPVLHRREVRMDRFSPTITVIDAIACRGEHEVEIFWHFSEACEATVIGEQILISRDARELMITPPPGAHFEVVRGAEAPILGWRSQRFDERTASPTIRATIRVCGDTQLATRMTFERRSGATQAGISQAAQTMTLEV